MRQSCCGMRGLQRELALYYKPASTAGLALPVIMCVGKIYSPVTPLSETVFDLWASRASARPILGRDLFGSQLTGWDGVNCAERPAMLRGLPVP